MIAVVVLISGGGSRFPWPAKFKTWRPIPSIDPTRSVRGISGAWTAEPIPAYMSFKRTCAGWRDYRVGPGEQNCERCETVAETVPHLAVAKACGGSFRLCEKWVSRPIRDVNGTYGVDSQEAVPVTHKSVSPDPLAFQSVTGIFPATRGPHGKTEVDGSAPPFYCPVRTRGCCAIHICATPPGGRSRPNYPSREGKK